MPHRETRDIRPLLRLLLFRPITSLQDTAEPEMSAIPKEENGSKKERPEGPLSVLTRLFREESLLLREQPDKRPLRPLMLVSLRCKSTNPDTDTLKDKETLTLILFLMDRTTLTLMLMVIKITIIMKERLILCTLKNTLTKMVPLILMLTEITNIITMVMECSTPKCKLLIPLVNREEHIPLLRDMSMTLNSETLKSRDTMSTIMMVLRETFNRNPK